MAGPLRSFLFAPATDLAKDDKALSSEADAVILDLEDAAAEFKKVRARSLLVDVPMCGAMASFNGVLVAIGSTPAWVQSQREALRGAGILKVRCLIAERVPAE